MKNRKKESNGGAVSRWQAPKGMRNKSRRAPARRYGEPFGRAWESAILLSLLPVLF